MNSESGRKPLEIRGHHLSRIVMLLGFYSSMGSVDEAVDTTATRAKIAAENSRKSGYKEDVSGTTEDEKTKYWERYRVLLTSFLTAPDDYPVRIIQDRRDDFCRLCVKGEHCSIKGPRGISTDQEAIWNKMGINYVKRLSRDGEIEIDLGELKEMLQQ